jgi:hypothetical protein
MLCCVGGLVTSTVFAMLISTKAQPMAFGDASVLASILEETKPVHDACRLFVDADRLFKRQRLNTTCIEYNTVDNFIALLRSRKLGQLPVLHLPVVFT